MPELDFNILEPSDDEVRNREPLPDGWYKACIASTVRKTSRAGNDYLEVELEITDADHASHRVWDRYNLWHPVDNTKETAQRMFSNLVNACGLSVCKESDDLIGLHFDVKLKTEAGNGEYKPKNKVTSCRTAPGMENQKPAIEATAVNQDKPPWAD